MKSPRRDFIRNEINASHNFFAISIHPRRDLTDDVRRSAKEHDMEFCAAIEEERAWWRFVARLLSFAALAEGAAHRSAPVRWLVLWILRHAEAIVEDYVADAAGLPPPEPYDIAAARYAPEDALALAARFMALAAMLAGLIRDTNWNDSWPAPRGSFGRVAASPDRRRLSGRRPPAWDTS